MKFKFLPHTADVKFRAYGRTLEEAFINAALAMASVIVEPSKVKAKFAKEISVSSEDEKALLYDFLEQFLILLDSEEFLLSSVKELKIIKKKKGFSLNANIVGDKGVEKYSPEKGIKAVTYQEMEIKKEKNSYMVQVVVDI
jgi:SHS2 domain-containing protein